MLAIPGNSAFSWVYLSLSPLLVTFLLSSSIHKSFSDNHFTFLNFFIFGMVSLSWYVTVNECFYWHKKRLTHIELIIHFLNSCHTCYILCTRMFSLNTVGWINEWMHLQYPCWIYCSCLCVSVATGWRCVSLVPDTAPGRDQRLAEWGYEWKENCHRINLGTIRNNQSNLRNVTKVGPRISQVRH